MEVTYTCQAAPGGRPNDDFVIATERYIVVLDGATAPAGVDSGCIHDVPWLVAQLGTHLARTLSTEQAAPLVEVLRSGIEATMASHADTCDLTNRDSPSTTVAILRRGAEDVEYAVLGDSAVIVEQRDGELVVGHDDRTSYLPAYGVEAVSQARNTEWGFWIASNRPDAADYAVTGLVPVSAAYRAAVVTDGITRLVERYGRSWADLLKRLDSHGPNQLVKDVRAEERATPAGQYRGKVHDDATAALCRF
ncbi:hypothetical protein ABH926_008132 [Catenulispora sp. GP43]|uniref:protein phosphatase 2C domain-containing protein n=1 Tax=Catenulispora sp. GP43 TaxID=3156263 RepID=UPI0035118201